MKKTILVIEDMTDIRDLLKIIFEAKGYRVIQAKNGKEALEIEEHIDVQITDLEMPGMNGFDYVEELKKRKKYIPTLVLTGYLYDLGDMPVIRKPFRAANLIEKVEEVSRLERNEKLYSLIKKPTAR